MVRIVKDGCLYCENLGQVVEFGVCRCGSSEVKKYSMADVEEPLLSIESAVNRIVEEGKKLRECVNVAKKKAEKRKLSVTRGKSKVTLTIAVDSVQKARAVDFREISNKAEENGLILDVLKGSKKSKDILCLIEKRVT